MSNRTNGICFYVSCIVSDMFAELAFLKKSKEKVEDELCLYNAVPDNPTIGRKEKKFFEELEVKQIHLTVA